MYVVYIHCILRKRCTGQFLVAVPTEAYVFLAVVLLLLVCLVVFFLYLNKKLCFSECGGFPCIDRVPTKTAFKNRLGKPKVT